MNDDADLAFRTDLERNLPKLLAFAKSLTGNPDRAADLVQEALVRAWQNRAKFEPGTNLKAWLFTVLRNTFISELRKRKLEVPDEDGAIAASIGADGNQAAHMDLVDFAKAFGSLPLEQREALMLVGAEGFAYEEAALMCGCAVGTMKSRVNRARWRLTQMLGAEMPGAEMPGTDRASSSEAPAGQTAGGKRAASHSRKAG